MKRVLAFTVTHGKRDFLTRLVVNMRATAGMWFDWLVVLSGEGQEEQAERLLFKEGGTGIQHLVKWSKNKGQHYATKLAIEQAEGYDYLLRLDDDVTTRAERWLKKMVERTEELDTLVGMSNKLVVCPRMVGLKHPIQPYAMMEKGQKYLVEVVPIAGGACRLHPVPLIKHYKVPLHEPVGRMDPQHLALFVQSSGGIIVRFPDIKFIHNTKELEEQDTMLGKIQRRMSRYWPYFEVEE